MKQPHGQVAPFFELSLPPPDNAGRSERPQVTAPLNQLVIFRHLKQAEIRFSC
jgi:hypothetical protein